MRNVEEIAKRYFDKSVTDRERAIFEGAITLGALYHQFTGTPVSRDPRVIQALEDAMERSMALQPYREKVEVKIDAQAIGRSKRHPYDYETLRGSMIDAKVQTRYGRTRAILRMRRVPELQYTLMYVEKVEEI